jgi:rhodanese-related sulfurtransferase
MLTDIDRDRVKRLMADGAQLVDVMPADEYADAHLAGALNIPLKKLNRDSARQLDLARPVIVHCYDYQ